MCNQEVFEFQAHIEGRKREVTADFSGGYLSSDGGGALLLRELEGRTGIIRGLAGCFTDLRRADLIEHSVMELLSQRIGALALGYEDLNDHDRLRHDPASALLAGKADIEGTTRRDPQDRGKALAAHSTLNRLELGTLGGGGRYKKIIANPQAIEAQLIEEGVKAIPRQSRRLVLDFDATDDPLHGDQEGRFFTGIIEITVTCRRIAFAATSRCWPSCATPSAMPAMARWRRWKRSSRPSDGVLASGGSRLSCAPKKET